MFPVVGFLSFFCEAEERLGFGAVPPTLASCGASYEQYQSESTQRQGLTMDQGGSHHGPYGVVIGIEAGLVWFTVGLGRSQLGAFAPARAALGLWAAGVIFPTTSRARAR